MPCYYSSFLVSRKGGEVTAAPELEVKPNSRMSSFSPLIPRNGRRKKLPLSHNGQPGFDLPWFLHLYFPFCHFCSFSLPPSFFPLLFILRKVGMLPRVAPNLWLCSIFTSGCAGIQECATMQVLSLTEASYSTLPPRSLPVFPMMQCPKCCSPPVSLPFILSYSTFPDSLPLTEDPT